MVQSYIHISILTIRRRLWVFALFVFTCQIHSATSKHIYFLKPTLFTCVMMLPSGFNQNLQFIGLDNQVKTGGKLCFLLLREVIHAMLIDCKYAVNQLYFAISNYFGIRDFGWGKGISHRVGQTIVNIQLEEKAVYLLKKKLSLDQTWVLVFCLRIFNMSFFWPETQQSFGCSKAGERLRSHCWQDTAPVSAPFPNFRAPSVAIWFHFTAGLEIVTELLSLPPQPHI